MAEMTKQEWESLCDGCGKCCLVLLEDDKTDDIWETNVVCKLFDADRRRCTDYDHRHEKVPGCVQLSADAIDALTWMPQSCAYRRLSEGRGLAPWHPLISGNRQSVEEAGIALSGLLLNERDVPLQKLQDYIIGKR